MHPYANGGIDQTGTVHTVTKKQVFTHYTAAAYW